MTTKKTSTAYLGVPQAQLDAAVQEYLAKNNQLQAVNTNQSQTTQTLGQNVKTIISKLYTTAEFAKGTNSANNGSQTVYTVPADKIFLLTNMFLQVSFDNGTLGNGGQLTVDGAVLLRGYGSTIGGGYAMFENLPVIVVVGPGSVFSVDNSNVKVRHTAGVFGYTVSSEEFYRNN